MIWLVMTKSMSTKIFMLLGETMKFEGLDVKIRDVQLVDLEILLEFSRICKKHDLRYQLFWGTLLGCVRHKGFIPWDDDIGVCMPRVDYERFINICETELDSKYFLQTCQTDPRYYLWFGKLRKNNTTFIQRIFKDMDMHHGISISIIPMDNVMPYTIIGGCQRILCHLIYYISIKIDGSRTWENIRFRGSGLKRLARYILFLVSKLIPKKFTDHLHTKVACMFNDRETEYVTALMFRATKRNYFANMMRKDDFLNPILCDFEGYQFPISRNYHQILTNLYGNYMVFPPIDQRKPHHGVIRVDLNKAVWD